MYHNSTITRGKFTELTLYFLLNVLDDNHSGDIIAWELGEKYTRELQEYTELGLSKYEAALADGVCAEQARLFLPAYGLYVRWYWTASVQSVAHFLNQRLEHDAQKEIQEYAKAILSLIEPLFPVSLDHLLSTHTID